MCVNAAASHLLGRADFLAIASAASVAPALSSQTLAVPPGLSPGNERAAGIAAASPFVRSTFAATEALARSIGNAALRESVVGLLTDPRPSYADKYASAPARIGLRDELARAGFVKPDARIEGIFPAGSENGSRAPQPFWATPGSGDDSHHAYPGGLTVHEYFNASAAVGFATTYDRVYFNDRRTIDRDVVVAAALYHDVMKSAVFQWKADGTLFAEDQIAGTGAHHVLSGAEAIVRGRSARFVITLLSAHAAPSLGDEAKVTDWCRAAALVAGVDAVAFGLVRKSLDGYALAPLFVPAEAFISNLSDHDYVLSIHAARAVLPELRRVSTRYGRYPSFAWFKNDVLAHLSAIGLYQTLASAGSDAFDRRVDALVASR
ncbi:MAG: hypothetical protein GIW95_07865 [Candidatus Eremiobacteraeota bacterium]|nr:hypothetical protein [Candidatus Eremiobacteraeota bacterium]